LPRTKKILPASVTKNRFTSTPGLILLGVAAMLLGWRIVATNMAELHLQGEEKDAATRTLDWDKTNAQALFSEGVRVATTDPAQAITYLAAAVRGNPTDGPTYAAIARLKEQGGNLAEAEQAMQAAAQMAPRRVDVQLEAARFWFRRGDIARAMKHMDVVLTFGGALREQIFPDLLKLAEDPATREIAHAKLLKQRIAWWPQFFNHAAAKATSVETLRALFQMQADGPNAVTAEGLRAYLQRLQRENLWIESYLVWLNHLRKDQLNAIGNLFNGGFEEEISNLGFDWILTPASQVVVDTASTYGATGHKALRVVFRGPRIQFQHAHQYLMLDPGTYVLHGRVRPDNLETSEGIQWSIYCVGNTKAIAHSERFTGTDHWQHFTAQLQIPVQDCSVQMLRLELAGRSALDFEAKGAIWFDDLSIARQKID
jgi:tetratricopeptide (TPR) repeat protein